jgi:uncharacterized protein (DUF2141 family)
MCLDVSTINHLLILLMKNALLLSFVAFFTVAFSLNVNGQAPVITTFSPASGPVGTSVTITGTNFSPVPANNIVYFGAVKATVTAATNTSLTVTVPAGTTYEPITVTTNGLTAYSSQSFLATFANICTDFLSNSFALKTGFDASGGSNLGNANSIRMADFDGDGKPDVVAGVFGGVAFYRNTSTVGNISFAPKVTYAAPAFFDIEIGDFNGDGKPDMVTSSSSTPGPASITILVNTSTPGNISFNVIQNFQTGDYRGLAISDFDGDGKPDIASTGNGVVSVFRNTTSGGLLSFAAKADFPVRNSFFLEARDLDNDGKPDLVASSVLRNISTVGNISFAPEVPLPSSPVPMAIGDLNEDNKPDIDASGSILKNNSSTGSIQFSSASSVGANANPVISDLNGDGKPDLASTNANQDPYFSVYKNTGANGEISFAAGVDYGAFFGFAQSTGLAAGDLDGDGKPDVVLGLFFSTPFVVFRNQMGEVPCNVVNPPAVASFSPASGPVGTTVTITGANFSSVAANNTVYFGAVKATVTSATATSLTVTVPVGATYQPITVTTDGLTAYSAKPFVVTSNCNNAIITSNSFAPKVDFPAAANPVAVAHGDLDGDGKPDLAVANAPFAGGSVSVFRNTSSAAGLSFSARVDFPAFLFSVVGVAIGDIDGDGKLDVVVVNNDRFSVFRNISTNGTIAFAPRVDYTYSPGGLQDITINDIDGDGKPDVALAKQNSPVTSTVTAIVVRNTSTSGAISFGEKTEFSIGSTSTSGSSGLPRIAATDLNADGKPDLAITNTDGGNVSILRNASIPGALSIRFAVQIPTGLGPIGLTIGDLDSDGKPDIAVANLGSNSVSVLRNTSASGSFSFASKVDFSTPSGTFDVAIGDLEGDGKLDLVVSANGLVSVLRNMSTSGTIAFPTREDFAAPSSGVVIGDLDGDAKPELVGANSGANVVSVLRNQIACSTCTPPTFNPQVVVDAACGKNDGKLLLTPTSGTAPYQYSINSGTTYVSGPDAGYTFENLSPGTYPLRIKDASGCESAIVQQVLGSGCPLPCTPPTFLNNGLIVLDASCGNNDGGIWIFPTSGTAPFMYSINGGTTYVTGPNTGRGFQNLAAGTYQLRLKDATGCESAIVERTIKTSFGLPAFVTNTNDATCGNKDARITITPSVGTAPFMYSIDAGATYVTGPNAGYTFNNLAPGTYRLRLKDAKGCESEVIEKTVSVETCPTLCTNPPTFVNNALIVLDASCGKSDGNINIIPTGGTAPFMYSINGGATYVAGPNAGYGFQNLPAGTYELRLKDARGCQSAIVERTVRNYYNCPGVTVNTKVFEEPLVISGKDVLSTYPNPSNGQFKLLLQNFASPKAEVSIFDAKGTLIQKHMLNLTQNTIADFDLKGKAAGLYLIKVVTASGIKNMKVVVQ